MDDIILPQRCELASDCFFRLEEWVQLCALEIIDTAMSAKNKGWYGSFKEQEKTESDPIIKELPDKKFETIYKLDFQAGMRMLHFRIKKLKPVFDAYNLDRSYQSDFQKLLKRLIDTRNDISGHLDADSIRSKYATMDSEEALRLLFRFREGILDFILFLSYFPDKCASDGIPYVEKARAEWNATEKLLHVYQYQVETVIENENLNFSVTQFAEFCKTLHIIYRSDDNGKSFFATDDYKRSVQAIRVLAANLPKEKPAEPIAVQPAPMPTTKKHHAAIVIAAVAVVAVLLVVIILLLVENVLDHPKTPPAIPNESTQAQQNDTSGSNLPNTNDFEEQPETGNSSTAPSEIVIPRIKGSNILGGLQISVDQIPSAYLTFSYTNDEQQSFSLGWVDSASVIVETTAGQFTGYVSKNSVKLDKNSTGTFSVTFDSNFTGTIQSITIKNILPLSDMGLPENASTTGLSMNIPISYG